MPPAAALREYPLLRSFWFWAAALTLLRIATLMLSDANLSPDEAQYWYWSREPAFGYFSKPPLIAWAIAVTTGLFGNEEWAVRLSAPFFHAGAAAFLYLTAKAHFDERIALWTGLAWATMPGVILSSFVIATDAPLLFFWSGAIFFLFRLVDAGDRARLIDHAGLGAALGFGFLSKYAMLYFPAAIFMAAILSRPVARALLRPQSLVALAIAFALAAPNVLWNAGHDFQTVTHTAANANWSGSLFHPLKLAEFIAAQPGVAGIVPFFTLMWMTYRWRDATSANAGRDWRMTTLLILALTPLIIVCTQAFISRAHANWAAAAYPAAMTAMTVWLFRYGRAWLAKASIGLHTAFAAAFTVGVIAPLLADFFGFAFAFREVRGWKELADKIAPMTEGYDAVAIDDRDMMGAFLYYQRGANLTVVAYNPNGRTDHHYEAFIPFDPETEKRLLIVSVRRDDAHIAGRFDHIAPLPEQTAELGGGRTRSYGLFEVSGYNPD